MRRTGYLFGLLVVIEDGGDVTPKRWLTFNGLHKVISQEKKLFLL
jgi:hypothetical protein